MCSKSKNVICGVLFSLSAGILWGIVPIHIKLIQTNDVFEIVAHRALWSSIILLCVCKLSGDLHEILKIFSNWQLTANFLITSSLLTLNWCIYVYAVQTDNVILAAFGYFIYPLSTVLLGVLIVGERLDRWAWVAIGLVFVGVYIKAFEIDGFPWISVLLAGSFSLYTVFRKRMGHDPVQGLCIETIFLLPCSLAFFLYTLSTEESIFFGGGKLNTILAVSLGLITVIPLILFHWGCRLLRVTTASLIFYSNPTTQLLLGVFLFSEAFIRSDLLAFSLIWVGIIVYFFSRPAVKKTSLLNL